MPINCTLTYEHVVNDTEDENGDIGTLPAIGPVYARAKFRDGAAALGSDGKGYSIRVFEGYLDTDGVLKNKPGGTPGMRVWANDPVLNLTRLPYEIIFDLADPLGRPVKVNGTTFDAPSTDVEVPLANVLPVPSAAGQGIARGPDGLPVDDVQLEDGELVSYVQGEEVGRVDISPLLFTGLTMDGNPVDTYDIDTTPPTPSDVGAYSIAETDSAIAVGVAAAIEAFRTAVASLTNKTLPSPKITTGIFDASSNQLLALNPAASAVNYLRIDSGAAGTSPGLTALGADATVNIAFTPKGSTPTLAVWASAAAAVRMLASGSATDIGWNMATKNAGRLMENGVPVALARRTVNLQTGTSYTLVLADESKVLELNNAAAVALTVPPNSTVAFPVGTAIELCQLGAGQVTVTPGASVTIRSLGGATKISGQYGVATLRKRATDEWVLDGNIAT
jgi:hypothetical protein